MRFLQKYFLIALNVFRKIPYPKKRSEQTAWLSLLTTENLEDVKGLIPEYPWLREIYEETGYIIDTHTAVAAAVYKKYQKESGDNTKAVIASTASPYKFTRSVMTAIDHKYESRPDFELVDELEKLSKVKVPQAIEDIRTAPVLHKTICEVEEMKHVVKDFLGV